MKNIILVSLIFIAACKTKKPLNAHLMNAEITVSPLTNCPKNGNCTLELIPNKTITFKADEFGNLYPLIADGDKIILKYTFKKHTISEAKDSNYTELIYAELDKDFSEIHLENETLKNNKFYFARLCFCKGKSGYFPISRGVFNLKKMENNSLKIDFNFSVKKIPQVISEIHETVSLKSNERK